MFAVPLARLGHDVTVVDPSADALATLRRRADTAGVGDRVRGIQGDGDLLHEVLPAADRRGRVRPGALPLGARGRRRPGRDPPRDRPRAAPRRPGEPRGRQPRRRRARAGPSSGHPVEALALHEGRDPAPARGRPAAASPRPTCSPWSRAPACGRARGGASPSSPTCSTPPPAPSADAVRALELALAETSPYRDVATGLHVLAARP